MNVPITLDITDLSAEFNLTRQDLDNIKDNVVKEVAAFAAYVWDNQAKISLHKTRETYRRGLIVKKGPVGVASVVLVGDLPNMIEQGAASFDMKAGFRLSSKLKPKKGGGWYLTVPFRWATPGSLGENSVFSNVLPSSIRTAVVRTTTPHITGNPGFQRGTGLTRANIPAGLRQPESRAAFSDRMTGRTFDVYQHRTSIYEGIRRSEKTYERATQSQYTSFRRVSDKSDDNSWIHRGFAPRNLAQIALSKTNDMIPNIVDQVLDQYL